MAAPQSEQAHGLELGLVLLPCIPGECSELPAQQGDLSARARIGVDALAIVRQAATLYAPATTAHSLRIV